MSRFGNAKTEDVVKILDGILVNKNAERVASLCVAADENIFSKIIDLNSLPEGEKNHLVLGFVLGVVTIMEVFDEFGA